MTGSPLALLGLLAVAVPIIIHLLGRYQSRVEKFPTLQFIGYSRQTPTARRRLSDIPLLLVRMAIVAVAAFALSQPSCTSRPGDDADAVSRVVIVDTSASMMRLTPSGPVASVVARQVADRESMGAVDVRRVETGAVAEALPGAIAWLEHRPGMRELVIVSDFQRGAIDSTDLASIPVSMGVTLSPIATTTTAVARVPNTPSIATLTGPNDIAGADAAWRAAGRPRPTDTTGLITILYRGAPRTPAVPVDSPWMARIIASLHRDKVLAETAAQPTNPPTHQPTAVAPNIGAGRVGARLQFEVQDDAGSLASAAFNAALLRAIDPGTPGAESDSISMTAEDLATWQRPATRVAGRSSNASDGRWIWLAALALIGLEQYMRQKQALRSAQGDMA